MNYRFNKEFVRFSLDVDNFDLISFFCLSVYRLAYFFDGETYLGSLNARDFIKSKYKFSKDLLRKEVIRDFHDPIKDHKKITTYFKETGLKTAPVINDDKLIGEFAIEMVYQRSKSTQKKIEAFQKINSYKELIEKYLDNNKDKKIAILGSKYYDFSNEIFEVIEYKDINNYDIVLDCYLDWSVSRDFKDTFIPIDEFLAILLLNEIKENKELIENLYFYSFDYLKGDTLYEDERKQLIDREDFSKTLSDKDYIEKTYGEFPKDKEYIESLSIDVNESVILINNGVYWEIVDSLTPGDLEDYHRVTPSNKEATNIVYYYGPCIAYGLYTSKYSTIEEFTQQRINELGLDYRSVNYGAPTGTNFLNDLFTFIYNENLSNGIHLFMNLIGEHVKRFLVKEGFKLFDATKYLSGDHYWFLNNEFHLSPYGHKLISDLIFETVDFSKKYIGSDLFSLRKIKIDPSYYLVEHNVEGYKDYLRKNKFPNKGKIGMIEISANPFTNGHAYLIDYAVAHCDYLYVFVVQDNLYGFPYYDRFALIKKYCEKYSNIKVLEAGAFLGSKHTITAYFYRDYYMKFDAKEDISNFKNIFLPILDIDVRFMGEEKESEVTNSLNEAYISFMKEINKELVVIPRISYGGHFVSASRIRKAFKQKNFSYIKERVPDFVYEYILEAKDDKI